MKWYESRKRAVGENRAGKLTGVGQPDGMDVEVEDAEDAEDAEDVRMARMARMLRILRILSMLRVLGGSWWKCHDGCSILHIAG